MLFAYLSSESHFKSNNINLRKVILKAQMDLREFKPQNKKN